MRASGVLMPIFSLPSPYGIGAFSKEAYEFVDQLAKAGQRYWQILPMGPTGFGDSPYASYSTFAGNPYFIDLETLVEEGLLTKEECENVFSGEKACTEKPAMNQERVDYGLQYQKRLPLLRKAFLRSHITEKEDFQLYLKENKQWLEDYAIFMALKNEYQVSWNQWPKELRLRQTAALEQVKKEKKEEILFFEFIQYEFARQWGKLKAYANEKGIQIIGDIPIYVAFDSADSWANPELFQFDEENQPKAVAGCPPDAFSEDGQLWGNPLYNWNYHRSTSYSWWCRRIEHCSHWYDVIRVDHFRGFDEYYSIPAGEETAKEGTWEKGPGMDLFETLEKTIGKKSLIVEDLGYITPSVRELVKATGYPNMKVLEFAFDPWSDSGYLPHQYDKNCVVYPGTHDNDTAVAWYESLNPGQREFFLRYLHQTAPSEDGVNWDLLRLAMMSTADTAVLLMTDVLGLGHEARINFPSSVGSNWSWRMKAGAFTEELQEKLYELTEISYRTPHSW